MRLAIDSTLQVRREGARNPKPAEKALTDDTRLRQLDSPTLPLLVLEGEYWRHDVPKEVNLAGHGAEPASIFCLHRGRTYFCDRLPEFGNQKRPFHLFAF